MQNASNEILEIIVSSYCKMHLVLIYQKYFTQKYLKTFAHIFSDGQLNKNKKTSHISLKEQKS